MADVVANDADLIKLIKKLPTGFKEECDGFDEKKLRDCIVESEYNLQAEIEKFENDEKFKSLKFQYKEAAEPLRDAKKAQKAKIQYCIILLQQKGKL
jgi:hypothetical protein